MVDLFEEVDEQMRSDHYKVLARRYLPWVGGVLLLALLVALGVWGYQRYQLSSAQKASVAYASGMDALTRGDREQAFSAFALAAKSPSPTYRSLALMQEAGIRLNQGKTQEAVGLFDKAAAATSVPVLADAARLKAAYALLDTAPYAALEARLKPLTDAKRPYAPLAREALAVAELLAGRTNDAHSAFVVLSLMADAPQDVRDRASAAKTLIESGQTAQLAAIVKAGLALPPPPPAALAGPQAAPADAGADTETPPAGAAQ